jgi:hypothetical protein
VEHQHRLHPAQEPDAEDEGAERQHREGEPPGQQGQPALEGRRRVFGGVQQLGDPSELRGHPGGRYDAGAVAIGDDGAAEGHAPPVAE